MKNDDSIPLSSKRIDEQRNKLGGWFFTAALMTLSFLFAFPDQWQGILALAILFVVLGILA